MRGGPQYLELQEIAKRTGRPLHELLQIHVLESFVDRLSHSPQRESFVLKGGVLLPAYSSRRPTRDVDLQRVSIGREVADVAHQIGEILDSTTADGTVFSPGQLETRVIRDDDFYAGVRLTISAHVATAHIRFHVDVSFGDPIIPEPGIVEVPRLIGDAIRVLGYPIEMVLAEKIVTAVQRGTYNTRWRDFVDVIVLAARHVVDGSILDESVTHVAGFRRVDREPLERVLNGLGRVAEPRWVRWREKHHLEEFAQVSFDEVVQDFIRFAGPAVSGTAAGKIWSPLTKRWEPGR